MSKHGGSRPGAGRKRSGRIRKPVNLSLTKEKWDEFENLAVNQSITAIVSEAVETYLELKKKQ